MARLVVYLGDTLAGSLDSDDAGQMTFTYGATGPERALSMSMPPRTEPYADAECRPFFTGLLPEGRALDVAAGLRRIAVHDTFRLLSAFGGDCAGAVRLLKPGTNPEINQDEELREGEALARLVADIGGNPNFAGDRRVRLSVAGAQSKTAVRMRDGRIYVPLNGSPSTHIIKVGSDSFPNLPQNETFCMRLAARCGLRAADTTLQEASGRKYCLVSRYDRRVAGASVTEIHQEDFCQALGYLPTQKYEIDEDSGQKIGPGTVECFELLRRTRRPGPDILQFLSAIVFNYLIGNADAHAKNYSLLHDQPGSAPCLAPFYDFVCTRIYPQTAEQFARQYGGVLDPEAMSREAWDALAGQASIRPSLVRDTALRLASVIVDEARGLITEEFRDLPPMTQIVSVIGERVTRLSRDLELGIEVDTPPFMRHPPGWGGFMS